MGKEERERGGRTKENKEGKMSDRKERGDRSSRSSRGRNSRWMDENTFLASKYQSTLVYRVISPWKYLQCITRFSLLFYAEKL